MAGSLRGEGIKGRLRCRVQEGPRHRHLGEVVLQGGRGLVGLKLQDGDGVGLAAPT